MLTLRHALALPGERLDALDQAEAILGVAMKAAATQARPFAGRWKALRPGDQKGVADAWNAVKGAEKSEQHGLATQIRPPRVAHAIGAALDLERRNAELKRHLRPFVIRHQHARGYREHFVGNQRR